MGSARLSRSPHLGFSQEQARDARARAWLYAFDCFNRRDGKEGGLATATDDAKEVERMQLCQTKT